MESYGENKKRSFGYDIGDQKLKLIDISSEDDYLIDFPLFNSLKDLRLSVALEGSGTSLQREKTTQVKELKHLSCAPIQQGRPSYLRKSSAWDNAFFTSAGLLDPHELSLMNKEFDNIDEHLLPVIIDRRPVPKRKNINNARAERSKTEQPCKGRECNSLDLKLPKLPMRSKSASTWQSKTSPSHMYPVDIGDKKRAGPGRDSMVSNSSTHSSITSCPLHETSGYARKRRETGKTKLSASFISSTKTPIRSSTKSKRFGNLTSSMEFHHSSSTSTNRAHRDSYHCLNVTFGLTWNLWSPSQVRGAVAVASVPTENSQPSSLCMPSLKFGFFDEDKSVVRTFDGNLSQSQKHGMSASIVKRARSPLCTDKVKKTRLIPSPGIKPGYAASVHKAKSVSYRASYNGFDIQPEHHTDKSLEIDSKICSKLRKVGAGEHDRKKVGLNSCLRGILKTKLEETTIMPQPQASRCQLYESSLSMLFHLSQSQDKGTACTSKSRKQENEVNHLTKYLELIDLNDGTETQLKQRKRSTHMRTPLVEKKYVCNRSLALRSDMVKDKESSNFLASKGIDKENN